LDEGIGLTAGADRHQAVYPRVLATGTRFAQS